MSKRSIGGDVPWLSPDDQPEDVTAAIGRDDDPENRVFRTPSGIHVKIKTWQTPPLQPGIESYFMTGSICDETGKAKTYPDGSPLIVPPGQFFYITNLRRSDPQPKAETITQQQAEYALLLERVAISMAEPLPPGAAPMPIWVGTSVPTT